jgi:hypothetical protein
MHERPVVIVRRHWRDHSSELAFVTRAVAGAASRSFGVAVLVTGPEAARAPDGAFDLEGSGEAGRFHWPDHLPRHSIVVVDDLTVEVRAGLARAGIDSGYRLSPRTGSATEDRWPRIGFADGDGDVGLRGPFVPVDPGAMRHRHHGFGFTGYVLVLSDRVGSHRDPPPAVAWLTAAFHEHYVVLVEDAVASAWKGRSLRGTTSVDTRMDLWRLVAHAAVCVDLAPGKYVARECVESLRLGTPIIVPQDAEVAASHARASGGRSFSDTWGLIEATDKLYGEGVVAEGSSRAKDFADDVYGDPPAFVEDLEGLLCAAPGAADPEPGPGSAHSLR